VKRGVEQVEPVKIVTVDPPEEKRLRVRTKKALDDFVTIVKWLKRRTPNEKLAVFTLVTLLDRERG